MINRRFWVTLLSGGAGAAFLAHLGTGGPLLHIGFVALIVAGAFGAVFRNPWVVTPAVLLALLVVVWQVRQRRHRDCREHRAHS